MKPFYSNKGKYKDGRKKVVIVFDDGRKNLVLPKPEKMLERFGVPVINEKLKEKGNKTFYPKNWYMKKAKILSRDNFKCVGCGSSKVLIHHIDGNRRNNKDSNLSTLCPICHKKAHMKMDRQRMENFPLTNQLNNGQVKAWTKRPLS